MCESLVQTTFGSISDSIAYQGLWYKRGIWFCCMAQTYVYDM